MFRNILSLKNVILTGVKSATLYDNDLVSYSDLSSQFYLSENDIGRPRAVSCVTKLSELNNYVPVDVYDGSLDENYLKKYKVRNA